MMLWKNRNKKVGLCVMVVMASLALAAVWAALATPETALADKPAKPGGNVKQQDISTEVTFLDDLFDGLISDGGTYTDGEDSVDCKTGRRRHIWVNFGKNSSRTMTLTLGDKLVRVSGDPSIEVLPDEVDLPTGGIEIDRVELKIADGQNVSGLGEEILVKDDFRSPDPILYAYPGTGEIAKPQPDPDAVPAPIPAEYNCMLTNMRIDFRDVIQGYNWSLYFGPGPMLLVPSDPTSGGDWPGGFKFTNPNPLKNAYVKVTRDFEYGTEAGAGRVWQVETVKTDRNGDETPDSVPGFLYFRGTKPNDPQIYVGAFNIPWSCTAVSLE